MKTKYYFLAAIAAMFASCANEEYIGDNSPNAALEQGDGSIQFGFDFQNMTRADQTGSTAATTLGNQFYVYGIKDEATNGAGSVAAGNTVYKNYLVKYVADSKNTTNSNTENWEYVGFSLDAAEQAEITVNNGAAAQTIKYWDWGAADYTFYAFSAQKSDITNSYLSVAKIQNATGNVHDNGYTVTLDAPTTPGDLSTCADLDKLFFAERVNIIKSANTNRFADNTYGGNVTLRFHNVATKVRVAMYETVPGYKVTINSFETENSATPAFATMTTPTTTNFAANFVNNAEGIAGTLTVKYVASGTTENHPTVSFAQTGAAANVLNLGSQLASGVDLGTSATGATYDQTSGAYNTVFPKENNAQNLKLKVNYTLTSTDGSAEVITVEDATAEIPAEYLKWKPGYCYTYIFKISENTNGYTGGNSNPAGLYPITFDASVVIDEDGLAEYITTVSEPSITTFGVKAGAFSVEKDEYETGSDIYATIVDNSTVIDPTVGTNVNVYFVTATSPFTVTEASVAESLGEVAAGANKITCTKINSDATTYFTAAPAKVASVPGEDGVNKTINALKLTSVQTAGTYAIEYVKTASTYNTSSGTYTLANESAFNTEVTTNGKLYTDADGTTEATWAYYNNSHDSDTYYRRTSRKTNGVYAYKIVKVVP